MVLNSRWSSEDWCLRHLKLRLDSHGCLHAELQNGELTLATANCLAVLQNFKEEAHSA